MQSVDFTTLIASCTELRQAWLPARVEQVYQKDTHTIALALRTFSQRGWLTLSWHPQAARICLEDAPPRLPDTFTFSEQLRHQLIGYALIASETLTPWERVIDCHFAKRPQDPPVWHLYLEIMGKYSNIILTDGKQQIITVGHQVNSSQSSVRTVQTGQPYTPPPILLGENPSLEKSFAAWQARVSLIGGPIAKQLVQIYRGVSPVLARFLLQQAHLQPHICTENLSEADWQALFGQWQKWLNCLEKGDFSPQLTEDGYYVLGGEQQVSVQRILQQYYGDRLHQEVFQQLRQQLRQKVKSILAKLGQKRGVFAEKVKQADNCDEYRQKADLLMAYLQQWQPGMKSITLPDFTTQAPVEISLNPEKTNIQNAQALYKQHQKLKRTRSAVDPLLQEVNQEIHYLEQVQASLEQLENYRNPTDLETLTEIMEELLEQKYLKRQQPRQRPLEQVSLPYRLTSPSGFEIWIGRNNRQNDQLTFRSANDYDLWFHSQEIAGSHVLLRLPPGAVAQTADLQICADYAAYYSQARYSQEVPVVYTQPKYLYKPKGAKPGMVVYKQEQVIWGCPQRVQDQAP